MSFRHIYTPVAFNECKDAASCYAVRSGDTPQTETTSKPHNF